MKTTSKAALVAFTLGTVAVAGQAEAQTIVRFPPKGGVPYTVTHVEPKIALRAPIHSSPKPKQIAHETRTANRAEVIR